VDGLANPELRTRRPLPLVKLESMADGNKRGVKFIAPPQSLRHAVHRAQRELSSVVLVVAHSWPLESCDVVIGLTVWRPPLPDGLLVAGGNVGRDVMGAVVGAAGGVHHSFARCLP